MTDNRQAAPVPVNKLAILAFRATIVNIVSWLMLAIPGLLHSFLSWPAIVTILLSGIIALATGLLGLLSRVKIEERGVGQCVIGIFVGILNVALIALVLIGIIGMRNVL
jgi:hypothetical protein